VSSRQAHPHPPAADAAGPSLSRSAGEGVERSEAGEGAPAANALLLLLAESLLAWRIDGTVQRDGDAIEISSGDTRLRVRPAPPGIPFRWMLDAGARERGVTGIPGLLRAVRSTLDPDYMAYRLQLAARPVLP
jgi:hypothetical protein